MQVDITDRSEQRKFGYVMAAAIAGLGVVRWLFHGFHWEAVPSTFFGVALAFFVFALVWPKGLLPIFWAWIRLALALNWVMTRVFLSLAFYGVVTPVRILVKIFSEDPLKRAWLPKGASYWETPEEQPQEFDRYRDQF